MKPTRAELIRITAAATRANMSGDERVSVDTGALARLLVDYSARGDAMRQAAEYARSNEPYIAAQRLEHALEDKP